MTHRRTKGCLNEFQIAKSLVSHLYRVLHVYAGLSVAFSFKGHVLRGFLENIHILRIFLEMYQ